MAQRDRIVSIDFWRGFALVTIYVNHIPGHVFADYTYRNFGLSDAAELFVFLAGVSAALAYGRAFATAPILATARIWVRAVQLYVAHLALVVVGFAVVGGCVVLTGDARVLASLHFDVLAAQPIEALVGAAMLTYQPAYLNILPLYVALLLMAPVLVALSLRSPASGLLASGALYLATQLLDLSPPVWPDGGRWYFNPFAWQFLLACGLAVGTAIARGRRMAANRVLDVAAPLYLLLCLYWAWGGLPVPVDLSPLPAFIWDFDKTNLALPRLLHVLALIYCVSRLPLERFLASRPEAAPVILMGRHGLSIFWLGTVLALTAQVTRPAFDGALFYDLLVFAGGVLLFALLAWTLEWYATGQKAAQKVRSTSLGGA